MKKIIALLLVSIMTFGMVACSNTNTTPTTPNGTSKDSWETKNVSAPAMSLTMQESKFTDAAGNEVTDQLVVSPLTKAEFIPEATLEALQKIGFLQNWHVITGKTEYGTAYFSEQGQMNAVQYGNYIQFCEIDPKLDAIGMSIVIQYSNDTDNVIGYDAIRVSFMNALDRVMTQAQMLDVLKIVYGNEYAQYLCYSKMNPNPDDENHVYSVIEQNNASVMFERYVDKTIGADFAINVSNAIKEPINGNMNGYTPNLTQFATLAELLHFNEQNSPLDVHNMGLEFLAKHYGEGAYFMPKQESGPITVPNSSFIYHEENEGTNAMSGLMLYYKIAQPGVEDAKRPLATMTTSVKGDTEETYCTFDIGYLDVKDVNDESRNAMREKALAMVKDILGLDEIEDPFAEDASFKMTLNGKEVVIKFKLHQTPDEIGNELTVLAFATSTELDAFDTPNAE